MLIFEILYLFSAALLAIYGFNSLLLTWLSSRYTPQFKQSDDTPENEVPSVTVQLPVYNERHVVKRLINAVTQLKWPADRLQIQILDDSTDDTRQIITEVIARYRAAKGPLIEHIRRPDRTGFKAGALQYGLASASSEFVAIFDADFIPPPDFLQNTIPHFSDARVGCVQTRWGHVNPDSSRLTQAQALGIDGHFIVEQTARHTVKAFLNFNGTAGVWRRACMEDAGGWQGDTLTEDLDLSYRAQFRGWRIAYLPRVVVPAELPVQLNAFKRQQFRWAKGSIQTALKLMKKLWQVQQPLWVKLMGTIHLSNYAVHPLMLLNLFLTLPMALSESGFLPSTVFVTSAIGPPLLYWTAMRRSGTAPTLPSRLGRLALLIGLGTGLSFNNSRAVFEAVFKIQSDFKRTPKFAVTGQTRQWQTSTYALPRDPAVWIELALALYAVGLLGWVMMQGMWWLILWLAMYTGGYSYIAGLAFVQAWETRSARSKRLKQVSVLSID